MDCTEHGLTHLYFCFGSIFCLLLASTAPFLFLCKCWRRVVSGLSPCVCLFVLIIPAKITELRCHSGADLWCGLNWGTIYQWGTYKHYLANVLNDLCCTVISAVAAIIIVSLYIFFILIAVMFYSWFLPYVCVFILLSVPFSLQFSNLTVDMTNSKHWSAVV